MGTQTLVVRVNGDVIESADPNLFNLVLQGDFVGRDASGAPTALQNLGTAIIPWGTARVTSLVIGGSPLDTGLITARPNRVISGALRVTSRFPDYLRASGSGASFTLLATATNLTFDVNGTIAEFTADQVAGSLTLAPSSNNTCLINDVGLTGQDTTKNLGENDTIIPVDNMGSELTGKIGEFVALLNQTSGEIMYCRVDSATQLSNGKRGFFFNSSGTPVERDVLNNNEVLQILSLGFIFIDKNGSTIDVTYRNPVIDGNVPASPQTGDYWCDTSVNVWKEYTGVSFVQIERTFAGYVVIDTVDCIGTRPEYFSKAYNTNNSLEIVRQTIDVLRSKQASFLISIDGDLVLFDFSFFNWLASTDFESGVTRTVSTDYWIYITEQGKGIISDKKPFDNRGFLKGWYHPFNTWRSVGQVFNNASDEFEMVNSSDATLEFLDGVIFAEPVIISNNSGDPVNDIDFSKGKVIFDDGTGEIVSPAITKRLEANWAQGNNGGGLDTGSIADTTYFCFNIYNPETGVKDAIFSASFSSPTLPSGFTQKEYKGAIIRDTGAILGFIQELDYFYLNVPVLNFSQSDPGVGPAFIPAVLTIPIGIKVLTNTRFIGIKGSGTDNYGMVYSPEIPDPLAPTSTFNNLEMITADNSRSSYDAPILTNTSGQVRFQFDITSTQLLFRATTFGWIDINLRKRT